MTTDHDTGATRRARARPTSASSCRRGDSPIPARASASTCRRPPRRRSTRSLRDAGQVHALTGACPTVALHVLWDLPDGLEDVERRCVRPPRRAGVAPGAINPNLFQDQDYKFGSFGNPDATIRRPRPRPLSRERRIARRARLAATSRSGSPTAPTTPARPAFASGSGCSLKGSSAVHAELDPDQRMLVEYKPFEPAFYHTDIADWGMALLLARGAGPQAKVLVDTGHHYLSQNIEQIVAWLLDEGMLGGFHFNDRRYADDDLTMGSIDPYQMFRIFHEILFFEWQTGARADIAYVVDQSHNLKGKIEAMIQTVDHGAGTVCEGRARRLRAAGRGAAGHRSRACRVVPAGRVRDRRPAVNCGMADRAAACRATRWTHFGRAAMSIALPGSARRVRTLAFRLYVYRLESIQLLGASIMMRVFYVAFVSALLLRGAAGSSSPTFAAQSVLPDAPGRDVTVKVCGSCHAPETVASVRFAPEGWREVIARMVAAGAEGTDKELATVFDTYRPVPRRRATAAESQHRNVRGARERGRSPAQRSRRADRTPREERSVQEARGPEKG